MPNQDPTLTLLIEGITATAELLGAQDDDSRKSSEASWSTFEGKLRDTPEASPLGQLAERFRLNTFELRCVLLGLASHIEPRMSTVVASSGRDIFSRSVTVRLTLDRFCASAAERVEARKSFLGSGALIRHGLIALGKTEAGANEELLARRVALTTPTLRFLLQEDELSESVAKVARLDTPALSLLNVILEPGELSQVRELVENHNRYRRIISDWGFDRVLPYGRGLTMLFSGLSGTGKTLLAHALASHVGRPVISLSAADLPENEGIDGALRDLFSEATMRDALVLIDECEALLGKSDKRKATAFKSIEEFEGILVLTTNHPERLDDALERRIIYTLAFELPEAPLRRQIWEVHLPPEVPLDGTIDLDSLANTYDFTGGTIKNAILVAVNRAIAQNPESPKLTMALLEEGCRSQLGYALEELTVRTTTHLRLDDIILPEEADRKIREMIAAVRNRSTVLNSWGFGKRLVTGKGIVALFDGPPGTGKTLCAEIIAGEFNRPLYRVNIPEVVSKWVGETEKHIREIFQQARISHAMLLFDEADSLFAARSGEAQSATDRYANMEVNLLLQEIERFPGICILTTNFFGSLDRALIRRIQFRVTFEEPDHAQRARIWETLCPTECPLDSDVDFAQLGKDFDMTGGMIKNALLRAAYWAADRGSELTMAILREACRDEFVAAGKLTRDPGYVPPKRPRQHTGVDETTGALEAEPAEPSEQGAPSPVDVRARQLERAREARDESATEPTQTSAS
ncbi:MAG: ATP-binding protein [Myxococcota bacterium]